MKIIKTLSLSLVLMMAAHAQAATVSLIPTNSGSCILGASDSPCFGDSNVGASLLDGGATGIRHFMLFDLSGLFGTVTSARLEIDAGGAYLSFARTQDYLVRGLSVSERLLTTRTTGADSIFLYNEIIRGPLYGRTTIQTPVNNFTPQAMPSVFVDLSNGVADLNAALGSKVAFGGHMINGGSLWSSFGNFGWNGAPGTRLILEIDRRIDFTVPTPSTLPLLLTGVLCLWVARRLRLGYFVSGEEFLKTLMLVPKFRASISGRRASFTAPQ